MKRLLIFVGNLRESPVHQKQDFRKHFFRWPLVAFKKIPETAQITAPPTSNWLMTKNGLICLFPMNDIHPPDGSDLN